MKIKTRHIIITQGLPGSGKTTWAKEYVEDHPNFVIVCRDDLRKGFKSGKDKNTEKSVTMLQQIMIRTLIESGRDVIVADTNLDPDVVDFLTGIATDLSSTLEGVVVKARIKSFTDVPVEECIKRDLNRYDSVGKDKIMRMYKRYLKPNTRFVEYVPHVPGLKGVYVFDMDGTLSLNTQGRDYYDASTADEDALHEPVALTLRTLSKQGYSIIILTAREDKEEDRRATEIFLYMHELPYEDLYMREEGDKRKDAIIKQEMYEKHLKGKYNIMAVYDDRDQVVKMWRSLGIPCFQVAEGDF